MYIHKEGFKTINISVALFVLLQLFNFYFVKQLSSFLSLFLFVLFSVVLFIIVWFFRIPKREYKIGKKLIIAPADGKIVVTEEVIDEEFFKKKVLQVSIFMNPLNVHVNRYPIDGKVIYSQYHKGKYLIASHPKSSTQNERHSVVVETADAKQILVKQIAGALAKRIVNYSKVNDMAKQNEELGFIKFGSRVDLLLPLDTKINVVMNQKVTGGITVIGELS